MLTGVPASIKYGLLKPGKEFDQLDNRLQQVLHNMLEMQSLTRFKSFSDVSAALQQLPFKMEEKKLNRSPEKVGFKVKYFLLMLFIFNLIGLSVIYFVNSDFQQFVNRLFY